MLGLTRVDQDCQPVTTKKSQTLSQKSQKKPNNNFKAYSHKTYITKHKIDIKTLQKHRYNTISIFRSIFFPRNYTVEHLFPISNIDNFWGNSKIFAIFCALCMVIDPRQKRFVVICSSDNVLPEPFRLKKIQILFGFFYFQKGVQKRPEFQNLASKNPNWQPWCRRVSSRLDSRNSGHCYGIILWDR